MTKLGLDVDGFEVVEVLGFCAPPSYASGAGPGAQGEPLIAAATVIRSGGRLLSTMPGTPEQSAFGREDLSVCTLKVQNHPFPPSPPACPKESGQPPVRIR
ncbi:hypothetical protein [Nonomuraea jabiensis]|uniref:Uncharacterized protein n=1 Tax=Nonomuraea jabiensis TaxID=882448 RepID=A0A7W9G6Y4_9ACTN|nr:hypothetical protein [Nonomuraea jabiensis]MBB5778365.1 hypothetical protein [Nonomuraea jabiensis]